MYTRHRLPFLQQLLAEFPAETLRRLWTMLAQAMSPLRSHTA